ncbi:hypothetical protein MTO96_006815 [Rhipicephalus appendiculatus]
MRNEGSINLPDDRFSMRAPGVVSQPFFTHDMDTDGGGRLLIRHLHPKLTLQRARQGVNNYEMHDEPRRRVNNAAPDVPTFSTRDNRLEGSSACYRRLLVGAANASSL